MVLMRVSTSHPLAAVVSQSAKPVLHDPITHAPATHAAVEFEPAVQRVPQRPQLLEFVVVLTSHPLEAMPSQSAKPVRHVKPHAPAVHVGSALAGAGHAMPHAPQCAGELRVLVSQPLLASESQSPNPPAHTPTAHAPMRHTGVALASAGHALPHAPQLATSFWRLVSHPSSGMRLQSPYDELQRSMAHAPATHAAVPPATAHARPHVPQLDALVCVSTHAPVQHVCPEGQGLVASHPGTHALARQRLPGGQ